MGPHRSAGSASFVVILFVLGWAAAAAADFRIPAKVLRLKNGPSGATLVFNAAPPSAAFPQIGSADDPATGSPGGVTVEIFTPAEDPAIATVAAGVGVPGWTVLDGAVDGYLYRGPGMAVRKIRLRQGKGLKIRAADVGLDLGAPLGAVAVRVTAGTRRMCALFSGDTVKKDEPGNFLARGAVGLSVIGPVCSDAWLLEELGFSCPESSTCGGTCPGGGVCGGPYSGACVCAYPSHPCGGTAPVCNGECGAGEECIGIIDGALGGISCTCTPMGTTPCGAVSDPACGGECGAGEECVAIDNGFEVPDTCACTPIGVTPCGAVSDPSCGGVCPAGQSCDLVDGPLGPACRCLADGAMCGPGPGSCIFEDIPCVYRQVAMDWICLPFFCGGTFPTCGGACDGGRTCMPAQSAGGPGLCICGTPGLSCDDPVCGAGGLECPAGEVCTASLTGSLPNCSCEVP